MSNLDLGLVTAYGYAKSQGYSDTEENFAIELADVKAYKEAAEAAAELAEDYKDEAFSGTPTGYEQLVSDVYSLETEEDTVLAGTPTFAGRVLLDKMYGMSLQAATPTPSSPVDIKSAKANFKNVGKNLLKFPYDNSTGGLYTVNSDRSITIDGTGSSSFFLFTTQNLKYFPYGRYTLSVEGIENAPSANIQVVWQEFNGNTWKRNIASCNKNSTSVSFSYTNTGDFDKISLQIQILASTTFNNLKIRPMLTFEGTTTEYEPYVNNSITTDLTLRAIEVTSSDDYNLVKDGKYYIADTLEKVDGGYRITRRIGTFTFNGTENVTWNESNNALYISYSQNTGVARTFLNSIKINRNGKTACLINQLEVVNGIGNVTNGKATFYCAGANQDVKYFYFKIDGITTSAAFNTWLTSNNLILVYGLENPTVETVSNADTKKLLSLKSYNEATYVAQTEDTEGVMVLKYGSTELSNMAVTGYVEGEQNSIRLSDLESAV